MGSLFSAENLQYFKWGKIEPRLLLMTNRKSHTRVRLVRYQRPSMTFNGHYALHCTKHASFGVNHENLNEDRPTRSAAKMKFNDSRFWQYKVYADIRGCSLETRRQMTVGYSKRSIFRAFGRYFLGTLGNEANIFI